MSDRACLLSPRGGAAIVAAAPSVAAALAECRSKPSF